MYMLACGYVLAGKANRLTIFKDGFTFGDVAYGYFMQGWDIVEQGDISLDEQNTSG